MLNCPNCDAAIDVDEEDLEEGETVTCDECGADLTVTSLDPVELEMENDEEEEAEEDADFDYDEDEDEEDEEEEDEEDWK